MMCKHRSNLPAFVTLVGLLCGLAAMPAEGQGVPPELAALATGPTTRPVRQSANSPATATTQRASTPSGPPVELGPTYRDSSFGFALRPFSSLSEADRAAGQQEQVVTLQTQRWLTFKRPGVANDPRAMQAISLVEFQWPERGWNLTAYEIEPRVRSTLSELADTLGQMIPDASASGETAVTRIAGRPGAVGKFAWSSGPRELVRYLAVVELEPQRFLVLTFDTATRSEDLARQYFPELLGSLQITASSITSRMLADAMEQGAQVLANLRQTRLNPDSPARLDPLLMDEGWYAVQIPVPNKRNPSIRPLQTVGFLRVTERRQDYKVGLEPEEAARQTLLGKPLMVGAAERVAGVSLRERGRVYQPNGVLMTIKRDYFVSDDARLTTSRQAVSERRPINDQTGKPILGPDLKPMYLLFSKSHRTLRQDNTLLSSTREREMAGNAAGAIRRATRRAGGVTKAQTGGVSTSDRHLVVPYDFLDPAVERFIPRVIDPQPKQLYAFTCYSHARQGLCLYTLRAVGREPVLVDGQALPTLLLEWREGWDGPVEKMWVDANGHIVKRQAGETVLIRTPRSLLQAQFPEIAAAK